MKTAKQELEGTLLRYNNMVNDVSKFKLNQREAELFTNMMYRYATEAIKADREKARFELRSKGALYQDEEGFYIPAEGIIANLSIELP